MSECIFCNEKDNLIADWKKLFYEVDAKLSKVNNGIEWLIKEDTLEICSIVLPVSEGTCIGISCGSIDCHEKLFTELMKRGEG
jgi:hypothetical protein